MKVVDLKKILLAGTAIVAVGYIAPKAVAPAYAADEFTIDADDNGTFDADELATSPFDWATNTDGTGAAAEATNAHDVQVNATGTINGIQDTNTIGDGTATNAAIEAGATGLTLTISDSVNDDAAEAVTIDGDITRNGNAALSLVINGNTTDATGDVLNLTIDGNIDLGTGTLLIDADTNVANDVNVLVSGNITATSTTLSADGGDATLTLNGTTAQTITGTIVGDGGSAGDDITVANAAGVTFSGVVGSGTAVDTILISNTGANSAATFLSDVSATAITLGDGAGAGTNTLTFDSTTNDIVVTGTVAGTAGDTDNVAVNGGGLVTAVSAWSAIQTLDVTGTGTNFTTQDTLAATDINIGAGATLTQGNAQDADDITGDIDFTGAGTLAMTADVDITGTVDNTTGGNGVGTLTIAGGTSVISGNVGATNSLLAITNSGTGTSTFGGTVAATTILASSTGTLDFNGNVTGNVNMSGDANILLIGGATITGNVDNTSGADNSGDLTLDDGGANTNTTITGNVGATNSLGDILIGGTGTHAFGGTVAANLFDFNNVAGTVNFAGDLEIVDLDFGDAAGIVNFADGVDLVGSIRDTNDQEGTVNFAGSSAITGALGLAAASNINAVNVNGAGSTVTVSANSFMETLATVATSTTNFAGNLTTNTSITNDGTVGLAVGTTLTSASFLGAGTYNIAISDDGDDTLNAVDFASFASAGAINLAAESVVFNFTGDVAEGAAVVWGTGGAAAVAALSVTDNSFLFDAALATNGNNHELTITRNDLADVSGTSNGQSVGAVLDSLVGTADPELIQVMDNIALASTVEELDEVLESVSPTVDGGAIAAGMITVGQTNTLTQTRLAALREGTDETGMTAGNVSQGVKAWVQGFGTTATQDERDDVNGYDLDTLGVAVGLDSEDIAEDWVFGIAFSYANSTVDSDNATTTETDINTYQGTLYGNYDISDSTYVSGQLAYAWGNNESTRHNVGGVAGLTADGEYDSNTISARVETGHDYLVGGNTTLTPKASVNYVHYNSDSFTETGAGGASLTVDTDSVQMLEVGIGVDASWLNRFNDGAYFKPSLHAGVRHDLIGDNIQATGAFTGGGATFETEGADPAATTVDLGAGFTYYDTSNWEFTGGYNYEAKSDYDSHSGILRASYHF